MIFEYEGRAPRIGKGVFIAPTAVVIGDVTIGDESSVWYGAVLRGDDGQITIGRGSNVQDNSVIHTTPEHPTTLGDNVTIGHGALLEGCSIESGAVIGMGAVVLEKARVGAQAMVAAGAVVTPATIIPSGWLAAGTPAVAKKQLSGEALRSLEISSPGYHKLARSYLEQHLDSPVND
jgi:carbonic anhydrase/acetyltransferase-like protein (isoleucine patch superfamily)